MNERYKKLFDDDQAMHSMRLCAINQQEANGIAGGTGDQGWGFVGKVFLGGIVAFSALGFATYCIALNKLMRLQNIMPNDSLREHLFAGASICLLAANFCYFEAGIELRKSIEESRNQFLKPSDCKGS